MNRDRPAESHRPWQMNITNTRFSGTGREWREKKKGKEEDEKKTGQNKWRGRGSRATRRITGSIGEVFANVRSDRIERRPSLSGITIVD